MKFVKLTIITALAVFGTAMFAAEKPQLPKEAELAKMAESASTASEHAKVAKAYRLRAEAFHQIAEDHEAEVARKQNGPKIGMAAKWPSMSRNSTQRAKREAVEARRVARECEELAALHTQLAVEKGFAGSDAVEAAKGTTTKPAAVHADSGSR